METEGEKRETGTIRKLENPERLGPVQGKRNRRNGACGRGGRLDKTRQIREKLAEIHEKSMKGIGGQRT